MTDAPIALITGGAQGIGLASAEALAEQGSRIVIADINGEKAVESAAALGGHCYRCDVGNPAEIDVVLPLTPENVRTYYAELFDAALEALEQRGR